MKQRSTIAPYLNFGKLLAARRSEAGISHQIEFAALVRASQQTVSRWELGQSRPRLSEIATLANVLNVDARELAAAAGYSLGPVVTSYDQPFPLDGLSPDAFERFSLYFVTALYPEAKVHRVGGSGHTQDGLDIDVLFPDGKSYHFQCKRVREFGPAKVRAAIKKYRRKAVRKVILLTRIASPKAREETRPHRSWDIWDKEDVSLQIRHLPKQKQIELIDIFFKGQRLALLGETEANVWQTLDAFFAPFSIPQGAFTHDWKLVGRDAEAKKLIDALENPHICVMFLSGPGGGGKSRLLKQTIATFQQAHPALLVRFLSPTEEVSNKSLEDLGDREKVLIVDDAHDRADLKLLFQYVASPGNKAKLLLSLRPYGFDFIKSQASNFALLGERTAEIHLRPLALVAATALATEVIEKNGGPVRLAKEIGQLTLDCPLATVMGAWIISKEKMHFEFAKNESRFRSTLMGKFRDVIEGKVSPQDAPSIRKLLRVLALIQPFHSEDNAVADLCASVEGLSKPEINRLLRKLVEAGVLFRREGMSRLSPDLLADYIIEDACIGVNGSSTGYAEQIFAVAKNALLEHVMLNLGKLDWRRSNGDPSNSKLLDEIWRQLRPQQEYGDPHLCAVKAVAYFQPERALQFAEGMMRQGEHLHDLPEIIKYAAYSIKYLPYACKCLWELGKDDTRPIGQNPNHAIRILTTLCAVEQNKPFEYNEVVVDFALSLLNIPDSWQSVHTPFDILSGIAHTEGDSTALNGRAITFNPYFVNQSFVGPLRGTVVSAAIDLLHNEHLRFAVRAAQFLQEMIRYPVGMFGAKVPTNVYEEWTEEFIKTLKKIKDAVNERELDYVVLIELVRSVSWHANYASGRTAEPAAEILSLLPFDDLEFRTFVAIIEPYGRIFEGPRRIDSGANWNENLQGVASDLLAHYVDGETLRSTLERYLAYVARAGIQINGFPLFWELLQGSNGLARATLEDSIARPESATGRYAAAALATIMNSTSEQALNYCVRFYKSGRTELLCALGTAYNSFNFSKDERDGSHLDLLRRLLKSADEKVVGSAIRAVSMVANQDKTCALNLLLDTDIGQSTELADDAFMLFHDGKMLPPELMTTENVSRLVDRLMLLPQLDGYWIQTFLARISKEHARLSATFFMRRVERAVQIEDWRFGASYYGLHQQVALQFRASSEFPMLLKELSQWLKSRSDFQFQHKASELFNVMFQPFDQEVISHLEAWIDTANAADIDLIASLLREAGQNLWFAQPKFVSRFLARAKQFGKKIHQNATYQLYAAATSGMRAGAPGELATKEEAEKVLKRLSPFSPEYEFYELIQKNAEREISRSLQQAELLDG